MAFFPEASRGRAGAARMSQARRGDPEPPSPFARHSASGPKFGAQAGKGNPEAPSLCAGPSASASKDGTHKATYGSRKAGPGVAMEMPVQARTSSMEMAVQARTSSNVVIDQPAASKHRMVSKHCELPGGPAVPNNNVPAMSWVPPGTDAQAVGWITASAAAPAADWTPSPTAGCIAAPTPCQKLPTRGAAEAHEVEPVSQAAKTTKPAASTSHGWGGGGFAPVQCAPPELVGCSVQDPIHLGRSGPAGTEVVRDGSLVHYPLVHMKGSAASGIRNSDVGSSPPTPQSQQAQLAAQQPQNRVARRTSLERCAAPDGNVWKGTGNFECAAPEEFAKPDVMGMHMPTHFSNFLGHHGPFRGHLGQSFNTAAAADVSHGDGCSNHCVGAAIAFEERSTSSRLALTSSRDGCAGLLGAASSLDFGIAADGLARRPEKFEFVDSSLHARTGGSVDVELGSTLKSTPCFYPEAVGSKLEQSTAGCRQGVCYDLGDSPVLPPGVQHSIQEAAQAEQAANATAAAQDLQLGAFVLVDGAADPSLNGFYGQVIGYDTATGMYTIHFGARPHPGTRDVDNSLPVADGSAQEQRTMKHQFRLKNKPLPHRGVARIPSTHPAEDSLQGTFPMSLEEDDVPKPDMPDADVSGPAEAQDPLRRFVPDHLDASAAAIPLPSGSRPTQPVMRTSSRAKPRRMRVSRLLQAMNFDA